MTAGLQAALGDRYRIERELGGGGMSRVYLAEETALGRRVVIKLIASDLAQGISAERFQREVKLAARLQQANIVPVLTAGDADGVPYYTMPYVDGESLRAAFGGTPVPPSDALSILRDVARALSYAHTQGIVHRDIKPENILLSSGAAVVTDFGIAKAISASRTQETAAGDATLTQAGSSIGTPAYMAPEQAVGGAVDHRADIYAWGVVAYELLTGAHPFSHRSGPQQLIAAHIAEVPTALATQAPKVPRAVADLVMQALEKDPAKRPASAELLVSGLSSVTLSGEVPTATGGGRYGLFAAGVALITLAAVLYLWKGKGQAPATITEQDTRVIAILPFRNVSADTSQAYFSAGITEELTSQLGKVAALRVIGRAATAQFDTVSNRLQRMGQELGVGSVVDGSVQLAGERVRINVTLTDVRTGQSLWSEKYDREVQDLFALQDDVARKVTALLQLRLTDDEAYRLSHAPTTNIEAYQVYLRARLLRPTTRSENAQQAALLKQAIQMDTGFALAWAVLARNYMFRSGNVRDPSMDSAMVAARRAIQLDPRLGDGYFAMGDLFLRQNRLIEAREHYLKALELAPSHDGAMADLSNVLLVEGKYDEALDWTMRAVQINPTHPHGPFHVSVALMFLGDDSVTQRFLLKSERRLPREPRLQGVMAMVEFRLGDTAAALARARRVVRDNPDNFEVAPMLAEIAALVQASDAEAVLKSVLDADPTAASNYSPANLSAFYAHALWRRGDTAQANRIWAQASAVAQEELRLDPTAPYPKLELVAIAAMQGRNTEALDMLERSGYCDPTQFRRDPTFAGMRQEPRFQALLKRMDEELAVQRQRAAAAHPELFARP